MHESVPLGSGCTAEHLCITHLHFVHLLCLLSVNCPCLFNETHKHCGCCLNTLKPAFAPGTSTCITHLHLVHLLCLLSVNCPRLINEKHKYCGCCSNTLKPALTPGTSTCTTHLHLVHLLCLPVPLVVCVLERGHSLVTLLLGRRHL